MATTGDRQPEGPESISVVQVCSTSLAFMPTLEVMRVHSIQCEGTVAPLIKNSDDFSKGASCSCSFDAKSSIGVALDVKKRRATPCMEGKNCRC